ncbi:hypothetical protein HanHA300_Chr02g0046241 [Helianthus annuus]|nr:hypothetical protein HanHA300_Chr02g0046241 [Helianthus annuus]KAJ0618140.1 hypothetical protein HanHA89_Chr02g0049821 [Helianthus annuus]KAJ0776611.1 hypothetical protein HanLR1_Chr02g0047611 [Helianthus annuus]
MGVRLGKEKYDVPYATKTWVLKTIGNDYKVHKCRFKKKHFYRYKDNKTRLMNRPKNIPANDFSQLLRLWSNKDVGKRCLRAKEIRMSQKNMHTAGPKSFARVREEMIFLHTNPLVMFRCPQILEGGHLFQMLMI